MNPQSALKARLTWWYVAINVSLLLAAAFATVAISGDNQRVLYVVLLTAICTSPLLVLEELNGRYILLSSFLAIYYLYFGVADVLALFSSIDRPNGPFLTAAEAVVLVGGLMVLLGYHSMVRLVASRPQQSVATDWQPGMVVMVGFALWALGTAAVWYWSVHVIVRRSVEVENHLSALGTTAIMVGRLVQPLGIMMLAYALAISRRKPLLLLILAIVAFQVVLGFVSDSKETAMRGAVLVILVKFLVEGRLPKGWLLGSALFVVFAFPVFQAYRYEVTHLRGVTNEQAADNLVELVKLAFDSKDKVESGFYGVSGLGFIDRASLKGNVHLIVERTGEDVDYQLGHTLQPLLTSFIPRLIWPDKPDVQAGQLMNQEFGVAYERDVYISPSHLGEMYWNFGWAGVIVGMGVVGALLGYMNSCWDLSRRSSLTGLLIISITIYGLCLRFEGTIATGYAVWLRSLAAIGLLHLMFSRAAASAPATAGNQSAQLPAQSGPVVANLMR
jgi:hypothetical protein